MTVIKLMSLILRPYFCLHFFQRKLAQKVKNGQSAAMYALGDAIISFQKESAKERALTVASVHMVGISAL